MVFSIKIHSKTMRFCKKESMWLPGKAYHNYRNRSIFGREIALIIKYYRLKDLTKKPPIIIYENTYKSL